MQLQGLLHRLHVSRLPEVQRVSERSRPRQLRRPRRSERRHQRDAAQRRIDDGIGQQRQQVHRAEISFDKLINR